MHSYFHLSIDMRGTQNKRWQTVLSRYTPLIYLFDPRQLPEINSRKKSHSNHENTQLVFLWFNMQDVLSYHLNMDFLGFSALFELSLVCVPAFSCCPAESLPVLLVSTPASAPSLDAISSTVTMGALAPTLCLPSSRRGGGMRASYQRGTTKPDRMMSSATWPTPKPRMWRGSSRNL